MENHKESSSQLDTQPVLTGKLLTARPLQPHDFAALYAVASDPLIWEQHPASDRHEESVFREFFQDALKSGGALVVLDRSSGQIIGSSRYYGYDPIQREVEIGWTFLARPYWGGEYNSELKRLMLTHAFQAVDRIVFLIGPNNIRSQRAIERIGAQRAGTRVDGTGRESVLYEITAHRYASNIKVVRARGQDLDAIMDLVRAAIADMCARGIDQWDEIYPSRSVFEQDLVEDTLWIATEDGTCRGVIVLNEHQAPEYLAVPWQYQHGRALVVHRLTVHPAAQGRGIASRLMDFAESYARSHEYTAIRLDAFLQNPRAIAVYTKRGYRVVGEVRFRKGIFHVFEKAIYDR